LDRLAQEGMLFEHAFTVSTWTRPAGASLLTGAYPAAHGVRNRNDRFSPPNYMTVLPQLLREDGFQTVGLNAMPNLSGELGFAEGFNRYDDLYQHDATLEDINRAYLDWLSPRLDQRTFALIWSVETHVPFTPPEEHRFFSQGAPADRSFAHSERLRRAGFGDREWLIDLYDDEIRYNDWAIGELISNLKKSGSYEDTLLIVLGDHGEAFYEHGLYAHGHLPHDELLRIPMIIKPFGHKIIRKRPRKFVELIDVFPYILKSAGVALPVDQRAAHWTGLDDGDEGLDQKEFVYSDTQTFSEHNRYFSIRSKTWKYIRIQKPQKTSRSIGKLAARVFSKDLFFDVLRAPMHYVRGFFHRGHEFLYDLIHDPAEQENRVNLYPDMRLELSRHLDDWCSLISKDDEDGSNSPISPVEQKALEDHLKKMGYL
jgi:arylsulfatase A-like enzyme